MTTSYTLEDALLAEFAKVGDQSKIADPMVLAKFTDGITLWYVVSYTPETDSCYSYYYAFGKGIGGWFLASSLQSIYMQGGERDMSFTQCRLSDILSGKVT